jgi:hypothetical protein
MANRPALRAVGAVAFVLVDEGQQFVATESIFTRGPVAPAVWRFDDGVVGLAVEFGFFLVDDFEVIEELEEHHPGEQRQAVDVAIEPLVLAQDLARAADQRRQVVARGQGRFGAFGSWFLSVAAIQEILVYW